MQRDSRLTDEDVEFLQASSKLAQDIGRMIGSKGIQANPEGLVDLSKALRHVAKAIAIFHGTITKYR